MLRTNFYISLLDFRTFDRKHYVVGKNENMLRIKVKQYDGKTMYRSPKTVIKYRNYWADRILQRERQSVTHAKVSSGIIDSVIHGFDGIILACGPHCSGKTFNIIGCNRKYEGIVPRLIDELSAATENGNGGSYSMSCVEIEDDRLFDLLDGDDYGLERRSCLIKDVSKHDVRSAEIAKRMLWKAHGKRTVIRENFEDAIPSHVCDFVVTFHWNASLSAGQDPFQGATESKCAKVHIVELAGINPNSLNPSKHQIRANRTVWEFSQFLVHATNKSVKNDSKYDYGNFTMSRLLKYTQESFSKERTTLKVICHVRPELEFLRTNVAVLKLGEALRRLPRSTIDLPTLEPKTNELQERKNHLVHELYLCGKLLGHKSMTAMSAELYERLRDEMIRFLQSKSDEIALTKWSYATVYTVISVFREYYEKLTTKESRDKTSEHAPFLVKNYSQIDRNKVMQTAEVLRQAINKTLAPLSDRVFDTAERNSWDAFVVESPSIFLEQQKISAETREALGSFEIREKIVLDVQDKLMRARSRMDGLQRERHLSRDERYDGDANVIVPAKERRAFLTTKRMDAKMTEAQENFLRSQKHLERTLVECSKLNDEVHARFKAFLTL